MRKMKPLVQRDHIVLSVYSTLINKNKVTSRVTRERYVSLLEKKGARLYDNGRTSKGTFRKKNITKR